MYNKEQRCLEEIPMLIKECSNAMFDHTCNNPSFNYSQAAGLLKKMYKERISPASVLATAEVIVTNQDENYTMGNQVDEFETLQEDSEEEILVSDSTEEEEIREGLSSEDDNKYT